MSRGLKLEEMSCVEGEVALMLDLTNQYQLLPPGVMEDGESDNMNISNRFPCWQQLS